MTPTHTHAEHGGRYSMLGEPLGSGPLESVHLVKYQDMQTHLEQITTMEDWGAHWRKIAPDDCSVCLGNGTDQIKGNKQRPCGGCYGLGKVEADGETPTDLWDLADIAGRIIRQLRAERDEAQRQLADAEVQAFIEQLRQRRIDDSIAEQEHAWRDGRGHGHGGQRHTGD